MGEVAQEMLVEELAAVVAIEAEKREGHACFDVFDLFQDVSFAAPPNGALFGPGCGDVDEVHGVGVLTEHGASAVGHGIGFEESRDGNVPLVGFDRNMLTQKAAGFRG